MTQLTARLSNATGVNLGRVHTLLGVQTLVIILGSINRLGTLTLGYVAPNEFLRWVDFHNLLTLPLISLSAFYLLKKTVEYASPQRESHWHVALSFTFMTGVYLLGASYGTHEVTNYLNYRFCRSAAISDVCQIVMFNDDHFSHWMFFTGFVLVNAALMFLQVLFPHPGPLSKLDKALLVFNASFIALGLFANLAFETIGLDLYVVFLLAVLVLGLMWRRGLQPLLIYYSVAYVLGFVATAAYKLANSI